MTDQPTCEFEVEFTEEEIATITAQAETLGFDFDTYLRVRAFTGPELPEPCSFFALSRRVAIFAQEYEGGLAALAQRQPGAQERVNSLAAEFVRLINDWDALYGPA